MHPRPAQFLLAALALCWPLLLPGAFAQQQEAQQQQAPQPAPEQKAPPDRSSDEKKAAEAERGDGAAKITNVPLLPLRGVSAAFREAVEDAERRNLYPAFSGSGPKPEKKQGVAPLFGGIGMRSGLTVGAEYYRNDFLVHGLRLEVPLRVSHRFYATGTLNFVARSHSPLKINFGGTYLRHTQDEFFGLGPGSARIGRSNFALIERSAYVRPEWDVGRTLKLFAEGRFTDASVFNGKEGGFPGTRSELPAIPGIRGARLFDAGLALAHDNRDTQGMTSRGGAEYADAYWNQGLAKGDFAYWKLRAEAVHFFPVFGSRRAFMLRGLVETNFTRGGSQAPFVEQAMLGGAETLRGYDDFRFWDRAGAVFNAEYRFSLNSWLAAFVFGDGGQVGPSLHDLRWGALHKDVGVGLRVVNTKSTLIEFMVGRSPETTRFFLLMFPRF